MLLWRFHKKFTLKPSEGKAVLWEAMHLWSSPETSWDGIQCDGDKASQIHRLSAPKSPLLRACAVLRSAGSGSKSLRDFTLYKVLLYLLLRPAFLLLGPATTCYSWNQHITTHTNHVWWCWERGIWLSQNNCIFCTSLSSKFTKCSLSLKSSPS